MENIQGIIRRFFESPWFFRIIQIGTPIIAITCLIIVFLRAKAAFKKSPLCISEHLRSKCLEDLAVAKAAQKYYNLIVVPDDPSPIRLGHTDGTILGHFHCADAWGRDELHRPIPSYKNKKWYIPYTWETIIYESRKNELTRDFFFTCKGFFFGYPT